LELVLTFEAVSYRDFPRWATKFVKHYGGECLKRFDGPDCRVQQVRLLGQELQLAFIDFPVQTALIADSPRGEVVLHAIAQLESNAA
jgi:hypothetical protein